ncbi:MAG: hypothetical protein Kow006_16330 [Gammaproteobacteria bacterium]
MAVNPILSHGVAGIQRGMSALERDAATIAGAVTNEQGVLAPDVMQALIQLTSHRSQVEASAAAIRRTDEALSSLLDL